MAFSWFTSIKRYYDNGTYTKLNVLSFVAGDRQRITRAECEQITGEDITVTLKYYYDNGEIDAGDVMVYVVKNKITQAEYEQITGETSGETTAE